MNSEKRDIKYLVFEENMNRVECQVLKFKIKCLRAFPTLIGKVY